MSCYCDGDLLTYRIPKRRGEGHTVYSATVRGNSHPGDLVKVWNPVLGVIDHVPVDTILMHQPTLLAG